jgi:hypothetical protein
MSDISEHKVDMQSLILAWEDEAEENAYYLDLETGDVLLVRADLLDKDELTDEIETHHERYLYIPKAKHKDLLGDLSDFIADVPDEHVRSILDIGLESPNPLFSVKKILTEKRPEELKRWEEFRAGRISIRIRQWFEANFISPIEND